MGGYYFFDVLLNLEDLYTLIYMHTTYLAS